MKLFKPNWVNHEGFPIFSIDLHPDGSRLATGGQIKDSGKIIIWNAGPIVDKLKEENENVPRVLCQMDHHMACVNVVRWSNNGYSLASGSDDKLIMIWQYVQGNGNFHNLENWNCSFTLRSHSGDVLDLAWSSNDQYLASCSVDNSIIIWNALKFPEIVHRISGHAGLVKGVTWDPVGEFLASQSDDKTLKIWKTFDWSIEKIIDEPFKQCTGTTHILRLNWSPDGQTLISAHAINNGAPTAQVIDRGNNWNTKLDIVGHRKAVTSVRFFPNILKKSDKEENKLDKEDNKSDKEEKQICNNQEKMDEKKDEKNDDKTRCLYAVGSRDRSISIWLTNFPRPLCVLQDIFDNPIMDLSWSKTSKPSLWACSTDGTIVYIEFDHEEVGYPLNDKETQEFFIKKYNYDIKSKIDNLSSRNENLKNKAKKQNDLNFIENPDILIIIEQQKEKDKILKANKPNILNENSQSQTNIKKLDLNSDNEKQIERRMPDGRRRITPICVSKPGDYDQPKPFGSSIILPFDEKTGFTSSIGFGSPPGSQNEIRSKTATEKSTIIVEKRDEKDQVFEISPVKSFVYNKSELNAINNDLKFNNKSQTENFTLSQKSVLSQKEEVISQLSQKPALIEKKKEDIQTTNKLKNIASLANKIDIKEPVNTQIEKEKQHIKIIKEINQGSVLILEPLKLNQNLFTKIGKENTKLTVHNSESIFSNKNKQPPSFGTFSDNLSNFKINYIEFYEKNLIKFKVYLNEKVSHVEFNKYLIVCACEDSTLSLINTKNGSQLCSPIVIDSVPSILCLSNKNKSNYLMCVSSKAYLYVWKFELEDLSFTFSQTETDNLMYLYNFNTLVYQQPSQFIISGKTISKSFITENGIPVLQTSCSRSYFFSLQTKCWHLIPMYGSFIGDSDLSLIFNSNGLFTENRISEEKNSETKPLEFIQSRFKSSNSLKAIDLINSNEKFDKQDFTLLHLESQLNTSLGLNSAVEYKFWLFAYARYLVENDYEQKLNELCTFLIGPIFSLNRNEFILTFKKLDLLKEILPIIAKNLDLQRLYTFYSQQLNELESNKSIEKNSNILQKIMDSSKNF